MATVDVLALPARPRRPRPPDHAGLLLGRRPLRALRARELRERARRARDPRPHRLPPALELLAGQARLAARHAAATPSTRVRTWVSPGEYIHRRAAGRRHGQRLDGLRHRPDAPGHLRVGRRAGRRARRRGQAAADRRRAAAAASARRLGRALAGLRRTSRGSRRRGDGAPPNLGAGCDHRRARGADGRHAAAPCACSRAAPSAPAPPPALWCYRADAERILLGGSLSDGGSVVAWLRETHRSLPEPEEAEAAIAAMAPDCHGLTLLPCSPASAGPGWSDRARRRHRRA